MKYIYFVLIFVPYRNGGWGKVSDLYESEVLITATNFEEMRGKIEDMFHALYPQSDGVNLEEYRLVGIRGNFDTSDDADTVMEMFESAGYHCSRTGNQIDITL
jgi:hypothetical protein